MKTGMLSTPNGESLSCAACQALLPEYVDGVLATPRQEAVARHLVGCTACREEERQWRLIGAALQHEAPKPAELNETIATAWASITASLATRERASAEAH